MFTCLLYTSRISILQETFRVVCRCCIPITEIITGTTSQFQFFSLGSNCLLYTSTSEKVEVELVAGSTSSKITYALPISVELKNGNTVLEQKYQNYIYLIRPKGQIPDISLSLIHI